MTLPQKIAGRYTVERALGKGGMGTVWLCLDEALRRRVAIKQINPGQTFDGQEVERARREARTIASIDNPHVVQIHDIIEDEHGLWLVMEYIEAQNLQDIVAERGRLDPALVARIGAQVATALAAAHRRGILHRDVKPANILVSESGETKLVDFGIARIEEDDQITRNGVMSGTPVYFSPELARTGEADYPADVWALGATLYAAVEGRAPYDQDGTAVALLHKIVAQEPRRTEYAGPLAGVLAGMMNRDPAQRWSMADAAKQLEAAAGGNVEGATVLLPAYDAADDQSTVMLDPVESNTQQLPPAGPPPAVRPMAQPMEPDEPADSKRSGKGLVIAVVTLLAIGAAVLVWFLVRDGSGDDDPADNSASTTSSTEQTTTEQTTEPTTTEQTTEPTTDPTTTEPPPTTTEPPPTTTTEPPPTTTEPPPTTDAPPTGTGNGNGNGTGNGSGNGNGNGGDTPPDGG